MIAMGRQVAKVSVDYSQYWVAAGPDIEPGEETIPALLLSLGPQAVAVITGLQSGRIAVTARTAPTAPTEIYPGWDVVAETDLECAEGTISVCDWAGPSHDELGELAIDGPGRYRLRVHARHREQVSQTHSTEEHHLLLWPVTQSHPPRLLTLMDAHGRLLMTEERQRAEPALDALDLAAATGVKRLAELVARINPPELSGELTMVRAQTVAPATARKVWNLVSAPWNWSGWAAAPIRPASTFTSTTNQPWRSGGPSWPRNRSRIWRIPGRGRRRSESGPTHPYWARHTTTWSRARSPSPPSTSQSALSHPGCPPPDNHRPPPPAPSQPGNNSGRT